MLFEVQLYTQAVEKICMYNHKHNHRPQGLVCFLNVILYLTLVTFHIPGIVTLTNAQVETDTCIYTQPSHFAAEAAD